ncbi:MAG: DUF4115 domain-containing protein [Pseudomonadota bacterium]|nr:DUF4115 domain-containing protein [Pseudomonadota bacterium]
MIHSSECGMAEKSCGARLKDARQASGMRVEDIAARLKVPVRVIQGLERDDWSALGAPVFVRGQLRSYARVLGITIENELDRAEIAPVAPPELVSHSYTPRYRRMFEHFTRRAAYVAITVAIAVPVWLATRPHLSNSVAVQPLELPAGDAAAPAVATDLPPSPARRTTLAASMASLPARQGAAEAPALSLSFKGESWVQVFSPEGRALEQGMLSTGDRRTYSEREVGRVVLGNAAAVEVQRDGSAVDLSRFSRENVARFKLSSDGSLAPVTD